MIALSEEQLVIAWESARGRPPVQRALALLAAAHPELDRDALSHLTIGERDAWLLCLREELFGLRIDCVTACPECPAQSSFSLSTTDLLAAMPGERIHSEYALTADGTHVRFRLPEAGDLEALASCRDPDHAERELLSRIVLGATTDAGALSPSELPASVRDALEREITAADPLAEIQIDLDCPSCGNAWRAELDVAAILLSELSSHALRLLRDVHSLARHYHWAEADILAMTPARRLAYLEMLGE